MRPFFFQTPEKQGLLRTVAMAWVGTPFVAHANVRGAGVDCVNLCAQILIACGHLKEFKPPNYVMDGGTHNKESQLLTWLDSSKDFVRIEGEPMPGDVLCFKIGRSSHHAGLLIAGRRFIHSNRLAREVTMSTLSDRTFTRRHVATYRPVTS